MKRNRILNQIGVFFVTLLIACPAWATSATVCDSGCDYTSISAAATALGSGNHTITVQATYSGNEVVTISQSGTSAEAPFTVTSKTGDTITLRRIKVTGSYVVINGFSFVNTENPGSTGMTQITGSNCTVSNNRYSGHLTNVPAIYTTSTAPYPENLTITGNYIESMGSVAIHFIANNSVISNNEFYNLQHDATRIYGTGNSFRGNYIHDCPADPNGDHQDIIQVIGNQGVTGSNNILENNFVINYYGQIANMSSDGTNALSDYTFRNNVFVNIAGATNIGIPNVAFYNNTFILNGTVNDGHVIQFAVAGSWNGTGGIVKNNIFINSTRAAYGWYTATSGYEPTASNNYVATPSSYAAKTGFSETGSVNGGNPLFVDIEGTDSIDFSLQSGSPAREEGADLSESASFTTDILGNTRTGTWDIGAYEYRADNQSTLLVTSANGTVTSNPAGINCGSTCSENYGAETSVTLTASPNSGYTFTGWSGGGCSGTGACIVTMTEAKSVTANYGTTQHNLTITKPGTGVGTVTGSDGLINCGSTCSVNYESGKAVTLAASPTSGSTFSGWSGGGCSGTGTCTATMTAAKSVAATFIPVYKLTVTKSVPAAGTITSSNGTINCGSTCSANYNPGTSETLTASANSGYTFTGWSGGGCSGTGNCTVSMAAATSVTATFATSVYNLAVTKSGTGSGSVTGSDGLVNCGSTCSVNYESGKSVTLGASAASGSTFSGWSGGCAGTGTCTATMTAAKSVTATFATSVVYKLTVSKSGTGSGTVTSIPSGISCGSTCAANYTSGTVTLAASANSGSTFYGWSGVCTGTGTCTVNMTAAKSVRATFVKSFRTSKRRR